MKKCVKNAKKVIKVFNAELSFANLLQLVKDVNLGKMDKNVEKNIALFTKIYKTNILQSHLICKNRITYKKLMKMSCRNLFLNLSKFKQDILQLLKEDWTKILKIKILTIIN